MAATIQPELFPCQQRRFARQHRSLLNGRVSTYAERLQEAIHHSGLKQGQIAERAGTKQQVISAILIRGSDGSVFTAQFARACGVDAYWLATGEGPMLPSHAGDLSEVAIRLARAWMKLPDFKQRGYLQAIMTDAATLEVFPELVNAMKIAAVATDPEYHRLTEGFIQTRRELERQLKLNFTT